MDLLTLILGIVVGVVFYTAKTKKSLSSIDSSDVLALVIYIAIAIIGISIIWTIISGVFNIVWFLVKIGVIAFIGFVIYTYVKKN